MSKLVSLSEAASIGIHGMVIIARSKATTVNVNQIAEQTGGSRHHIAKILQRLVKDKLLSSNRGPGGGFKLYKPAAEITLLEIYESIEGKVEETHCPLENPICSFEKCLLENIFPKVIKELRTYLSNQTLDKYIKKSKS